MKYHMISDKLYRGKECVGHVRVIDYRDNGRHGYGISQVKNHSLLKEFQNEANRLFPDAENPYIDYLDIICSK